MPAADLIPACPAPPKMRASRNVTKAYKITLLTSLFGGGVEAGEPDTTLPIRGTAIRGQLQFWWRATMGAACTGYQELFAEHKKIWGATDQASPVRVAVRDVKNSPLEACARWVENPRRPEGWLLDWHALFKDSPLPYAVFPFQGKPPRRGEAEPEEAPARFVKTASFTLELEYPAGLADDVETAMWAWVQFGGLGARTRRGCGSLRCDEIAPASVQELMTQYGQRVTAAPQIREWATLPPSVEVLTGSPGDPLQAWRDAIGLLQTFRQGVGFARNAGEGRKPGRSRYPEPETLRRVLSVQRRRHQRLEHIPDSAFPRAELGLPIVFHFQGNELPETELYPADGRGGKRERMASPLIIKPLGLAGGKAVPLILRLRAPLLTGVVLKNRGGEVPLPPGIELRGPALAKYRGSPLKDLSEGGSALEAFMAYARKKLEESSR